MRIAVLGAGAVGSYRGGMLSRSHEVILIGREAHVDAVRSRGLRISGMEDLICHPQARTHADALGEVDLTLMTVKAFDMESACVEWAQLLSESRTVLVIQNGLAVLDTVPRLIGARGCIGVASFGVTFSAPGEVRFLGKGDLLIGGDEAAAWAQVFRAAGVEASVRQDITREVWKKALVSSAINPITAVLGKKNGYVADDPWARALATSIYEEGADAALARSALDKNDVDAAAMIAVAERTRENTSSMLQDVSRGRGTEVVAINGELVRLGVKAGLKMPYNRSMCLLVQAAGRRPETPRTQAD